MIGLFDRIPHAIEQGRFSTERGTRIIADFIGDGPLYLYARIWLSVSTAGSIRSFGTSGKKQTISLLP
jgi:hypothetical protein